MKRNSNLRTARDRQARLLRGGSEGGQALVEFAITGSLALLALAFYLQIAMRMNYQQQIEQQTFRKALYLAKQEGDEESGSTVVHQFRDRQIPDPSFGFAMTPRTMTNASATVTWGEHLTRLEEDDRDSNPRIVVILNEREELNRFRSEDFEDGKPLVNKIDKTITVNSTAMQDRTSTRLSTNTTEDTEMFLHTKSGVNGKVTSRLVSPPVSRTW